MGSKRRRNDYEKRQAKAKADREEKTRDLFAVRAECVRRLDRR